MTLLSPSDRDVTTYRWFLWIRKYKSCLWCITKLKGVRSQFFYLSAYRRSHRQKQNGIIRLIGSGYLLWTYRTNCDRLLTVLIFKWLGYIWCGNFVIPLGGTEVDDELFYYPFVVTTFIGFGFVLLNYFSWHTPFDKLRRIVN